MSFDAPNPNGGPYTVPHATVVVIDGQTGLPVGASGAAPQKVTTGQITSLAATIASGASVSGDLDLGTARLGRIVMPAAWTAADLTFQASYDGTAWNNLYDNVGGEYKVVAAASRSMLLPLVDMLSVRYLRLRSGTSATPVVQAAARSIVLVLVP